MRRTSSPHWTTTTNHPHYDNGQDRNNNDNNHYNNTAAVQPLYITIGTQCCGKTTFLKHQLFPHSPPLDVSLDDQPDVYVSVETTLFLHGVVGAVVTKGGTGVSDMEPKKTEDPRLLQRYQGKTLGERIRQDNHIELTLVLQRFHGDLSSETFASRIREHYQKQQWSLPLAQLLIDAVEQECALAHHNNNNTTTTTTTESLLVPSHVQVFILESLFQPHPSTQQSAIDRAHRLVRQTPPHIPVAWGNTNSKPRDYQRVLDVAWETRRPVRFLVQGRDMASVPLPQLLRRNLQRFSQTGKYIPAVAMDDCHTRISRLLSEAGRGGNATTTTTTTRRHDGDHDAELALEQRLIQMAEAGGGRQYRYRLTRNRLLHREHLNSNTTRYYQGPTMPPTQQQQGGGGVPHKRPRRN